MTKLHLVRHGETDWNVEKRYQGSKDIPLNERGRLQAQELAQTLLEMPFAGIYSSNLMRAYETAAIIKGPRDHVIEQFPELKEGSYGSLEGKTFAEIEAVHGDIFKVHSGISNAERLHFKFVPDMESAYEVVQRTLPILEQIAQRHPNQDVLVVTHGGVIRALLVHLANCEWSSVSVKNCQLVTFLYAENRFIPL